MKALDDKAESVFHKLTEGMVKVGDHHKWDNAGGSFMPVCIEVIDKTGLGLLVSVAHYYEQNSDLMRDPDVVFLIGADKHVYPISYRQDNLGLYQEAAVLEDGLWKVRQKLQADICRFCNQWLRTIKDQQNLEVKS
jgi:hypothetical protein